MTPTQRATDFDQSSVVRAWATWIDDVFRITRDILDAQRRFTVTLLGAAAPMMDAARQAGEQAVGQAQRVVSTTADVTREAGRSAAAAATVDDAVIVEDTVVEVTDVDDIDLGDTDLDDTDAEGQVADLAEVLDDVTEDLEVDTDLTAVVVVDTESDGAASEAGTEGATSGGQGEAGSAQDVAERAAHRVEEHEASDGDSTDGATPTGGTPARRRTSPNRRSERAAGKPRRSRPEG